MKVHPAIAALRRSSAYERGDQSASAISLEHVRLEWLATDAVRSVADDLALYARGQSLAECPALRELMDSHAAASAFVQSLCHDVFHALSDQILGEAPFRFRVSQGLATLQLLTSKGATLSLAAYEPLGRSSNPSQTALFCDRAVDEIIISGQAKARRHAITPEAKVQSDTIELRPGVRLGLRPLIEMREIVDVERSLMILQLTREADRPRPTREVDLETGAILRTASGDKSASQSVMALSVLGALKSYGALDVMERTALNAEEDIEVRWEAVRQTLGLGAVRGVALLQSLAKRADDPLAKPAENLLHQVLESQPDLSRLFKEKM